MNDDDIIRKAFEGLKNTPIPPTEFFVSRVMARLEEAPVPARRLWERFWKAPALVLAAAALFLIFSTPVEEPELEMDNLIGITAGEEL